MVSTYKYLGLILDQNLSFKPHIEDLVFKLRIKQGFFFREKSHFFLQTRRHLSSASFLLLLDCGDLLFMNTPHLYLKKLDAA